ncbi:hypothetical protein AURDEDRAFT_177659 [Auricularia subglabra TFB-10046 SS5]|uniref:Uncharacterized protein n=1 Tax=Auricularia subglabra (strain TFB-10046 / SS5) TaxID=717982 RepID=J0LA38_AURST|nr:hypothetical protein AURDEDRAFT_177659 [Auricularia subglabra TFB-10046 SS5]
MPAPGAGLMTQAGLVNAKNGFAAAAAASVSLCNGVVDDGPADRRHLNTFWKPFRNFVNDRAEGVGVAHLSTYTLGPGELTSPSEDSASSCAAAAKSLYAAIHAGVTSHHGYHKYVVIMIGLVVPRVEDALRLVETAFVMQGDCWGAVRIVWVASMPAHLGDAVGGLGVLHLPGVVLIERQRRRMSICILPDRVDRAKQIDLEYTVFWLRDVVCDLGVLVARMSR